MKSISGYRKFDFWISKLIFGSITYQPHFFGYFKTPKNRTPEKNDCNYPKIGLIWIFHRVMCQKDADGMANRVDLNQSDLGLHCLLRAVCSKINLGKITACINLISKVSII